MVSDESRARQREEPTGFPGTGASIWTPLCCRGDARWRVGLLNRRRGSWGSETSPTPLMETSRGKDDLDEVGERKKVAGLHGVAAQTASSSQRRTRKEWTPSRTAPMLPTCHDHPEVVEPSSPRARSGGLRGARNGGLGTGGSSRGDRPIPSREPPTSLESVTTGDVGGVRNTTRGHRDSWDAALMMAASHGRPPSVACSFHSRGAVQQPEGDALLLHSRRAGSSARLLRTRRQSTKGRKNAHRGDPKACSGVGLTHSSRTYRAVADALEERSCGSRRAGDAQPAPRPCLLSPIEQSEAGSSERWLSALFCEPGALDDAFLRTKWLTGASSAFTPEGRDPPSLPAPRRLCGPDRALLSVLRGKADEALVVEYPEWPDA
ncbi:hypothetical protein GMRT_25162 [Giardia muris]|uniref:Uncharacterized protein n=1 Tax=Giardia muris TaxID=5742 RepID=A0A4Z1SKK8_GIAMU|nr:hypothetical protein GMRT_25162 [Giardia muris]|eukprot:TNJ26132.1 hypothetical protein GMRT_25162 [Giardia muris]